MDPYLDPRFVLPLVLAIIGLIAWLVRLEAKNEANTRAIAQLQEANTRAIAQLQLEIAELRRDFEAHRMNQDIHFNLRISQQVEQGNERRFQTIEKQLSLINDKLDRMAERK